MLPAISLLTAPTDISVGGETVSAAPSAGMAAVTVMEIPAQDCLGVFAACTTDCTKTFMYNVYQVGSGASVACASSQADSSLCESHVFVSPAQLLPQVRCRRDVCCAGLH